MSKVSKWLLFISCVSAGVFLVKTRKVSKMIKVEDAAHMCPYFVEDIE